LIISFTCPRHLLHQFFSFEENVSRGYRREKLALVHLSNEDNTCPSSCRLSEKFQGVFVSHAAADQLLCKFGTKEFLLEKIERNE
jgi:hypothetical protein